MRKYKAYEVTLFRYVGGGYSTHWGIRGPGTVYYHHRVGGPAYVNYNSEGTVIYMAWDLDDVMYHTEAEYQKALEKWLNEV